MKNSILFTIMLLSALTTQASDNPNYRSFKKFNNDTLTYLKENFDGNEYYVGKTLGELFKDMEIQIKFHLLCPDVFGQNNLHDAILYFEDERIVSRFLFEKKNKPFIKSLYFFPADKHGRI